MDALEGGENAEEILGALEDPYDADDAEAPHGFSWSLVDFTFEWTDSLDPNTIFIDAVISEYRLKTTQSLNNLLTAMNTMNCSATHFYQWACV